MEGGKAKGKRRAGGLEKLEESLQDNPRLRGLEGLSRAVGF